MQGILFDENGNLNILWTKEDEIKYNSRIAILYNQYKKFKINGEYINPLLTLNENIAYLCGVTYALKALENIILTLNENNYKSFFISYGKVNHEIKKINQIY